MMNQRCYFRLLHAGVLRTSSWCLTIHASAFALVPCFEARPQVEHAAHVLPGLDVKMWIWWRFIATYAQRRSAAAIQLSGDRCSCSEHAMAACVAMALLYPAPWRAAITSSDPGTVAMGLLAA